MNILHLYQVDSSNNCCINAEMSGNQVECPLCTVHKIDIFIQMVTMFRQKGQAINILYFRNFIWIYLIFYFQLLQLKSFQTKTIEYVSFKLQVKYGNFNTQKQICCLQIASNFTQCKLPSTEFDPIVLHLVFFKINPLFSPEEHIKV